MKNHLALLVLLLVSVTCTLHANSNRGASFYLNAPEKYEGKKITLFVAEVRRRGAIDNAESVLFSAYTMTRKGDESSFIEVLVPNSKAESFAKRYGSDMKWTGGMPHLRPMHGILRQLNDAWFLEISPN